MSHIVRRISGYDTKQTYICMLELFHMFYLLYKSVFSLSQHRPADGNITSSCSFICFVSSLTNKLQRWNQPEDFHTKLLWCGLWRNKLHKTTQTFTCLKQQQQKIKTHFSNETFPNKHSDLCDPSRGSTTASVCEERLPDQNRGRTGTELQDPAGTLSVFLLRLWWNVRPSDGRISGSDSRWRLVSLNWKTDPDKSRKNRVCVGGAESGSWRVWGGLWSSLALTRRRCFTSKFNPKQKLILP